VICIDKIKKILNKKDCYMTSEEIAEIFSISQRTVIRKMKCLVERNIVESKGGKNGGYKII
jgi:DNA-binding IscR family transcriptional regulator